MTFESTFQPKLLYDSVISDLRFEWDLQDLLVGYRCSSPMPRTCFLYQLGRQRRGSTTKHHMGILGHMVV